jgi:outer membrane protein assembly factor BamB
LRTLLRRLRKSAPGFAACIGLTGLALNAQDWLQWGQNARHTGSVSVVAQKPWELLGQFTYDPLADQIRGSGDLLVHYMAPLVSGNAVYILSRGNSTWVSCSGNPQPCGTARWPSMTWGVTRVNILEKQLSPQWSVLSTWTPPPDNGSGWEPVFHPALYGNLLYMPGGAGTVLAADGQSGKLLATFQPFGNTGPNRYVSSPLTIGPDGSVYYTVIGLDAAQPWTLDATEGWLVKIDPSGAASKVAFAQLLPNAPSQNCFTTFAGQSYPWPPAPDAVPPAAPCGSQRPALNAAPAVAPDGTVYVISRAHLNQAYGYLVAVNPNLTLRWAASLRDRLNDGCGVLLPANGTLGGCRDGSALGVDPATNLLPAGQVSDQSTASPVVAPDGSILLGTLSRYNYERGHLFHFSSGGNFLGSYDFGWDITPGIYAHDNTWSAIVKDNFYPVGSYCAAPAYCGQGVPRYSITSLAPNMSKQWSFTNTNTQSCRRIPDGSVSCSPATEPFEWCVNMVAVDSEGLVWANSEDGYLYAIDSKGNLAGRIFLKSALGAAYTPLAIGGDGRVYTQNDGTLFATGLAGRRVYRPLVRQNR